MTYMAEDEPRFLERFEHDPAPVPGSARDVMGSALAQAEPSIAQVEAQQQELAALEPGLVPVPVHGTIRTKRPRDGVYRTMVVNPGAFRQLLPQDPQRWRAVVLAVDAPVILCDTKDLASDNANQATNEGFPTGFWLPTGIALEIQNRGLVWVVNPNQSTTSAHVSMLVERYETTDLHVDN